MIHDLRTINFQELIIFQEIVRTGSITATADKLNMAKSAVSTQLQRLENRLNTSLFLRAARRLSLTKEGERLLPKVESLILEGLQLLEQANEVTPEPSGVIRIAMTPDFGALFVKHFIPALNAAFPKLQVVVKLAFDFEDLQDPSFDFAIRIGKVVDDNLVVKPLGHFHRILATSPALAQQLKLQDIQQLPQQPLLLFSDSHCNKQWHLQRQAMGDNNHQQAVEKMTLDVTAVAAVRNFSVLAQLAAQGVGIAQIPTFIVNPFLETGQLQRVLPQWRSPDAPVYMTYRVGSEGISRIKAAMDIVVAQMPQLLNAPL